MFACVPFCNGLSSQKTGVVFFCIFFFIIILHLTGASWSPGMLVFQSSWPTLASYWGKLARQVWSWAVHGAASPLHHVCYPIIPLPQQKFCSMEPRRTVLDKVLGMGMKPAPFHCCEKDFLASHEGGDRVLYKIFGIVFLEGNSGQFCFRMLECLLINVDTAGWGLWGTCTTCT